MCSHALIRRITVVSFNFIFFRVYALTHLRLVECWLPVVRAVFCHTEIFLLAPKWCCKHTELQRLITKARVKRLSCNRYITIT